MNASESLWKTLLGINVVLLVLLAWSFPRLSPGTAEYVVAQLNFAIIGLTTAGLLTVIYFDWNPFV